MRISFGTVLGSDQITGKNGYGYATLCMLDSLKELGYTVKDNDASADVEIWFDQPHHWNFSEGTYKIGYLPWESTKLQEGWLEIMNACDEIWTPSSLIAGWFKDAGLTTPVFVYEHGIDHSWAPVKRAPEKTIKFLHVGAEASRKGGWDVRRSFNKAFGGRKDVHLTMKTVNSSWNKVNTSKVTNLDGKFTLAQMQFLFYTHDVFVYPSWGEGFGLTPLQAMATGMPTICTGAWAPYKRFLEPDLIVPSTLSDHMWDQIHPGKMFRPDFDFVTEAMKRVADDYEPYMISAASRASEVHKEYDWNTLTAKAFGDLEKRLK